MCTEARGYRGVPRRGVCERTHTRVGGGQILACAASQQRRAVLHQWCHRRQHSDGWNDPSNRPLSQLLQRALGEAVEVRLWLQLAHACAAQMRLHSCGVALGNPALAIDSNMTTCTLNTYAPALDANEHTLQLQYSRHSEHSSVARPAPPTQPRTRARMRSCAANGVLRRSCCHERQL